MHKVSTSSAQFTTCMDVQKCLWHPLSKEYADKLNRQMFAQAGQLHIQRYATRHNQYQRRSISHLASEKQFETALKLAAHQKVSSHSTKVQGNKLKANQDDRTERNRCRKVGSSLMPDTLDDRNEEVASRSRSLDCQSKSPEKRSEGRHLQQAPNGATHDKFYSHPVSSYSHRCSHDQIELEYSSTAQARQQNRNIETETRIFTQTYDQFLRLPHANKSANWEDQETKLKVDEDDCGEVFSYGIEGAHLHRNPMEERTPTSIARFNLKALYCTPVSRFIGYTLFIGRLIENHLQFRSSISDRSRRYLELVPWFCVNFIAYQLETLTLLTQDSDQANEPELASPKRCRTSSDDYFSIYDSQSNYANKNTLNKLAWRSRGNQFNTSVDEMYGAAARLGRTNRAGDHRLAHLNERLSSCSIDQQSQDKRIRAKRSNEKSASSRNFYVRELSIIGQQSDSSTLDGYGGSRSPQPISITNSPRPQPVPPRRPPARGDVAPVRPNTLECSAAKNNTPSKTSIEIFDRANHCSLDSSTKNSSRSQLVSGSLPASVEAVNHQASSRLGFVSSQGSNEAYQEYGKRNYSRAEHPPSVAVITRAEGSSTGSRLDSFDYPEDSTLVCTQRADEREFFYLLETSQSGSSDDHLFAYQYDNFARRHDRNPINSDSELYSDVHGKKVYGLQRQSQIASPIIGSLGRPPQHHSATPKSILSGPADKSLSIQDHKADEVMRPKSVTTSDSKTRSTSSNSGKKSSSYSKLSLAGAKRRLGLKEKGLNSISVQRSEEVAPFEVSHLVRQTTAASLIESGNDSNSHRLQVRNSSSNGLVTKLPAGFISGLGQGQIASRQAIVSPYLGDIQLSLSDQRGLLEVEIVRASRLHAQSDSATLPSPFVKIYLIKHRKCLAKFKTRAIKETLNPLYQEKFTFRQDYADCILQVIVWGDYGRKAERKSLMGIVQIRLNDLDVSDLLIGWYQLFNAPSIVTSLLPSEAIRQIAVAKSLKR